MKRALAPVISQSVWKGTLRRTARIAAVFIAAVFIVTGLATQTAYAGGAELWELGTPDVGLAAAGWAARAEDAATVFKNPAGMSRLDGPQLEFGMQATYGNYKFNSGSDTTVAGNDGGNAVGFVPGGSFFWAQPVHKRVAIGFGVFSYFGTSLDYGQDFVGRYKVDKAALLGLTFMPSLSVKLTDWLSLGAGFNMMLGFYNYEVAVNNANPSLDDGRLKVNDKDMGFGVDLGALASFKHTRIGMTYLSPVKLKFSSAPKFSGLGAGLSNLLESRGALNGRLGVTVIVPQSLVLSLHQQLSAKWAVMGNLGWQNWKRFGQVGFEVDPVDPKDLSVDLSYQDTVHVAIGARYQPFSAWVFSTGFAYDSSAVSDSARTISAPMGEAYRMSLGAEWAVIPALGLGVAYTLAWSADLPVDQSGPTGTVQGAFEKTALHFLATSLQWHIGASAKTGSASRTASL